MGGCGLYQACFRLKEGMREASRGRYLGAAPWGKEKVKKDLKLGNKGA